MPNRMSAVAHGFTLASLCFGGTAAVGCAEESKDTSAEAPSEDVAASEQALQASVPAPVCVTVRRGVTGNVADTFLAGDYPSYSPGNDGSLWTGHSSGGAQNLTLLRFDLSFLPRSSKVTSAKLNLYVSWNDQNNLVFVHRVLAPWSETTATFANFGAPTNFLPTAETAFFAGDAGAKSADITSLAQGWVSGSIPNHGVLLEEPPAQQHLFWSSESSLSYRPALALCFKAGLSPRAGHALVAGGITSDSASHHFIGTLGESPGGNRIAKSQNHKFIGGLLGATQE